VKYTRTAAALAGFRPVEEGGILIGVSPAPVEFGAFRQHRNLCFQVLSTWSDAPADTAPGSLFRYATPGSQQAVPECDAAPGSSTGGESEVMD
jgi:hypothetical protein